MKLSKKAAINVLATISACIAVITITGLFWNKTLSVTSDITKVLNLFLISIFKKIFPLKKIQTTTQTTRQANTQTNTKATTQTNTQATTQTKTQTKTQTTTSTTRTTTTQKTTIQIGSK